ncbi:MAG: hypothetical protein HYY44_03260 [Deltaproteobacteria bacterium]|nr:hypothetical protein [Deltaproteobacteria bacterium]
MTIPSILSVARSGQSVFKTADLALLWGIHDRDYLKNKICRLVKNGGLIRLKSGLFVWGKNYDPLLAANKIVSPSYVSLQTVLAPAGALFQFDSAIYSIAQISTEKKIGSARFVYRKIRDEILFQKRGVLIKEGASVATPERAFLDWLYLNPSISVDHPDVLDKQICLDLVPLYKNKALERRLKRCFKEKNMKRK